MRVTKDYAIAVAKDSSSEVDAYCSHFNDMIEAFLKLEGDRTVIINHVVSKYLATKFLNASGLHEFNMDQIATFVKYYVDYIACSAARTANYYLPFKEITRLTYGYATMFNNITYHEYVVSPVERISNVEHSNKDYFYNIFNGGSFISPDEYAILSKRCDEVNDLSITVCLGMKLVNSRNSDTILRAIKS